MKDKSLKMNTALRLGNKTIANILKQWETFLKNLPGNTKSSNDSKQDDRGRNLSYFIARKDINERQKFLKLS